MSKKPLFGYCADYLKLSDASLADLITKHSTRPCSAYRAERIKDGLEPIPAYAWSALKSLYRGHCPKAEKLIQYAHSSGKNCFLVTVADMENAEMSDILVRAILQLPAGIKAGYDPYAPSDAETWGMF